MNSGSGRSSAGGWTQIILCGVISGAIINAIEWIAHRVWLDDRWNAAFAALGKVPSFWGTFVVANFLVGIVAIASYCWLARFYGPGTRTAVRTAIAMWIIFWVVPIAGMQPFDIFPNYLLALVVAVGFLDAALGMMPAIALYDRIAVARAPNVE